MAVYTVTFADTLILPGSSAPNITAATGGSDLLVLDMSAAPSTYAFTFGQVVDVPTILAQPDASGFYYWYFPPVARHGVTFSGIEQFNVSGGASGDTIVTGNGADTVGGGAGDDVIYTHGGAAVVDGGAGTDDWSADFSNVAAAMVVDLNANLLTGVAGSSMSGIESLGINAFGVNAFRTGSGNDTVDTKALLLNDYVNTGNGNDRVTLRGGLDTVDLGGGTDTLAIRWADASSAMIFGPGSGDFTFGQFSAGSQRTASFTGVERFDIVATALSDSFLTGNGNDTVVTGDGNDSVSTRAGEIVIDMGAGDDVWGFDYRGVASAITIDIRSDIIQGLGASSIAGIEALRGTTGESNVYTGDGNDRVVTDVGALSDYVVTGAGNDTVTFFNGVDAAVMGTGVGDDDVLVVDWRSATSISNASAGMGPATDGDHQFTASGTGISVGATGIERLAFYGGAFRVSVGGGENADTLAGGALDDNLLGQAGADSLNGGAGNDTLVGGAGADILIGGLGADSMTGGADNDAYYVDSLADVVVEAAGGGTDTVLTSISYALSAGSEVERLQTSNTAGTTAIQLTGSSLANTLFGNAGANTLDGAGGADTMTGYGGDDQYRVDNALDIVVEAAGGGTDTILTTVSYTLAAASQVERLAAASPAAVTALVLTGSSIANQLVGNAGANTLNGAAGADTMTGGAGSDVYFVDNAGDRVVEIAGGGQDRVYASVSYTLAAEVEVLALTGTAATGIGNALANTIAGTEGANGLRGLDGNDVLSGLGGNDLIAGGLGTDRLTGGAGLDSFLFDTAPSAANADVLVDFVAADDTIRLENAVFGGLPVTGALAASAFRAGVGAISAADASDRVIYDTGTGRLYFDADGVNGSASILIAVLSTRPVLTSADFLVV